MKCASVLVVLAALVGVAGPAAAKPPGADLLRDDPPKKSASKTATKSATSAGALMRVEAWDAIRGEWRVSVAAGGSAVWLSNRPAPLALGARVQRKQFKTALDAVARGKLLALLRRVCQMRHDAGASAKYRYKFTLQRPGKKRCYVVFDGHDRNRRRQRRRNAVLAQLRQLLSEVKPKKMPALPRYGAL